MVVVAIVDSPPTVILAIGVSSWPTVARLVRARVPLPAREDFVMPPAARLCTSAHHGRRDPAQRAAADDRGGLAHRRHAILTESALSFLTMGDPNVVSWGGMIGDGRERSDRLVPHAPSGRRHLLTVLALNFSATD